VKRIIIIIIIITTTTTTTIIIIMIIEKTKKVKHNAIAHHPLTNVQSVPEQLSPPSGQLH